jgi:hypothetical protein
MLFFIEYILKPAPVLTKKKLAAIDFCFYLSCVVVNAFPFFVSLNLLTALKQ